MLKNISNRNKAAILDSIIEEYENYIELEFTCEELNILSKINAYYTKVIPNSVGTIIYPLVLEARENIGALEDREKDKLPPFNERITSSDLLMHLARLERIELIALEFYLTERALKSDVQNIVNDPLLRSVMLK